jgi:hypothetical protein
MGRRGAVKAKWDHGTIGKLLLEHTAVWLAAEEDVSRVLRLAGHGEQAEVLDHRHELVRPLLDRMAEISRGVQPISLAISPDFVEPVEQLREVLADELGSARRTASTSRIATLLGEHLHDLRSAKFIRKHAPAHPGRHHWLDHVPGVVRTHSVFDRLRGFPWGESSLGDRKLAREYDREI